MGERDTIDLKALRKACGCEILINLTGHRYIRHCPTHAAAKDMLAALHRIASLHREGEPLDASAAPEYCQRSPHAAFSELDKVIAMARETTGEPAARGGPPDQPTTPEGKAEQFHQRFHHFATVDWRDCPQAPCPERAAAAQGGAG